MSKILVTGVNGFAGRHLANELSVRKYAVFGIGGSQKALTELEDVAEYQVIDLMNVDEVMKIDFSDVDCVIHLAGLTTPAESFSQPQRYLEANTRMQINLFEAALAQDKKPRFLVVSSGSLYDAKAPLPISETSPVLPNSPYAVSKLAQEQLGKYYGLRGFEVIIARPFNHIGPGQGEGFIVPDLAKQIVSFERGELETLSVGNLDAKRDYSDVRDIVSAYCDLLERGKAGETYNICSGVSHSGQEILDELLSYSTVKPAIVQDPARMRPSDTPDIYGDTTKLRTDTQWQPRYTLAQSLKDALEDWRNR